MPEPTKKESSLAAKAGAGFIILIILLSGSAFFLASGNNSTNQGDGTTPNTTVDTYTVESLAGKVTQVFPQMIVAGQTSETDKISIDETIQGLGTIDSFSSQFAPAQSGETGQTYIANIILADGEDADFFIQQVRALPAFSGVPDVLYQAAAEVETALQGTNTAGEQVSFTLPQSIVPAIVNYSTVEGDTISGPFSAFYQGGALVNAYLLEGVNETTAPQAFQFLESFPIAAIENQIVITGELAYDPSLTGTVLQEGLSAIPNITSVEIPLVQGDGLLKVVYSNPDAIASDLNILVFTNLDKYNSIQKQEDGFTIGLGNISIPDAEAEITQVIQANALTELPLSFEEPSNSFVIDANISGKMIEEMAGEIQYYFSTIGQNSTVEVYQNASLEATELFVPDLNKSFPAEGGIIPAIVLLGHGVGDLVTAEISTIIADGQLVYANGRETQPQ